MEIKIESMKRCELVTVSGQIDSASSPALDNALQEAIRSGKKNLVINLRDVSFISSAGLRALIAAHIAVRRKVPAGAVVLSECSPAVKSTLELVGFHHQFRFFDQDLEAVGSF